MFAFLLLLFPAILLALPLVMERVERALSQESTVEVAVPPQAGPPAGDLEGVAAAGYAPADKRYRMRAKLAALRPQRSAARG